jgi:hypothetical protein
MSRRNVSIGILQRVEKYLLEMPQSSTSSQMKIFHRYFTESWEIFTANAIIIEVTTECGITDERYANRRMPSGMESVKNLPTEW